MKIPGFFRKKTVAIGILVVVVAAACYYFFGSPIKPATKYTTVQLTRGDIETTISSSGTLSAVTQVEVGTQVSGIIDKIFIDYNSKVKKGQVIAVLDTLLLRLSVTDAETGYLKAQATYEEALASSNRSTELAAKGMISDADFTTVKTTLKSAKAALISAEAALARAKQNLKYAIITSPIDGTVIDRSVEQGQTVAASYSTPTLFTIAQDLSKMMIKASVDESDIGQVKEGQNVRFTVQAFPTQKFDGVVKQIRVQPTTTSNVVNYTVVITADNDKGLLLPGMTATVDFIISQRKDVLLVPNTALRFTPSDEDLAALEQRMQKNGPPPDSSKQRTAPPGMNGNGGATTANGQSSEWKTLYFLDAKGNLAAAPVKTGNTDGSNTEVVEGGFLKEGSSVITGIETSGSSSASTTKKRSISGGPGGPPPF